MNIIGIDSGSSTVKLIEVDENGCLLHKLILNKTSIDDAINIFIKQNKIDVKEIKKVVVTGVGKNEVGEKTHNIPTEKVEEFTAIGKGGLYLAKMQKALVVSIGTGTAFVEAEESKYKHIGGTGIGGGTLLNLCKKFAEVKSFDEIDKLILKGNLDNIDLTIKDISTCDIIGLPKDTTSSNFGKLNNKATKEDIVVGIANMIFETIGMMAVFATQNKENRNIIVIGNVAIMPYIKIVLNKIEELHKGVKFIIPKYAEFGTAFGAIQETK